MTERTFTRIFIVACFVWVGISIYLGGESKIRQHMYLWPGAAAIVAIYLILWKRMQSRGAIIKDVVKPRLTKRHVFYVLGAWLFSHFILFFAGIEIYRMRYIWSEGKIWFVGVSAACIGIPIFVWAVRLMFEIIEEHVDQATKRITASTDGADEEQVGRFGQDSEKRNINGE